MELSCSCIKTARGICPWSGTEQIGSTIEIDIDASRQSKTELIPNSLAVKVKQARPVLTREHVDTSTVEGRHIGERDSDSNVAAAISVQISSSRN
jgi:hypothetical protein